MIINYHCGDLKSPAWEEIFSKKAKKFEKFAKSGEPVLDVFMSKDGKNFTLKSVLKINRNEIVSKVSSEDMYKNIELALGELKSQIVDKKSVKPHSKYEKAEKYSAELQ